MNTEHVTDGILIDMVAYHFGFEPGRPRVVGYNQQPRRKNDKDLVQISVNTKLLSATIYAFFPLTESLITGVKRIKS